MRDRLSPLADPEIIGLINKNFIAATDNDWYNRRRQDAIGKFFIKVADQGPRKAPGTRQGHYIFTPDGKLLGYNNNSTVERRLQFIREAINKWDALPASEKKPGAVLVPPLDATALDPKYHAEIPEGGFALVASERILKRDKNNHLTQCSAGDQDHEWGHLAAIDRMWIQKSEWDDLKKLGLSGTPSLLPDRLARRLARFHLIDYTRGEPTFWNNENIKKLDLSVKKVSNTAFEISGSVLISNEERGFDASLLGKIEVKTPDAAFPSRFDMVVIGEHWGDGQYTRGSRPGKSPLGIAFQLADPNKPEDRIRPQASHYLKGYWEAEVD